MKNTYTLTITGSNPTSTETFTNKAKAIKRCRDLQRARDAVNELRKSEGTSERIHDRYVAKDSSGKTICFDNYRN